MLQQTQVKTVLPYFEKFTKEFPSITDLAEADLQTVLKMWEGLGYYARARNFHKAAKIVTEEFSGKIPSSYDEFRKLPGVGEYIGAAVQSIAFGHSYAVVDGNVKRVLARLFNITAPANDTAYLKTFQEAANEILDTTNPGDFNQAMMELGATICRPQTPLCDECPISQFCWAFEHHSQDALPIKKQKKKTPEYRMVIGVIRKRNQLLITKRPENGLLGGFWEFPGGKISNSESAKEACLREIKTEVNLDVAIKQYLTQVKHAYTHFKIVADVFLCNYVSGEISLKNAEDFKWITTGEIEKYPFPKSNHKFIPLLKKVISRDLADSE